MPPKSKSTPTHVNASKQDTPAKVPAASSPPRKGKGNQQPVTPSATQPVTAPTPATKKGSGDAYPNLSFDWCLGDEALTANRAKQLLGWEVVTDEHYQFIDLEGKRIRCMRNLNNRPFDRRWAMTLAYDVLNKVWRFNGESIIIGRKRSVLSAQHRLIALCFADQLYQGFHYGISAGDQSIQWKAVWGDSGPTMETCIVYGVDESPDVVRTLDNVKPRTFSDILMTEEAFAGVGPSDRQILCKMTDWAVRMLWHRTGAEKNPFTPYRSNTQMLGFAIRHSRLFDAVSHIHACYKQGGCFRANGDVNITANQKENSLRMTPGNAAALLYLMAAQESDGDIYRHHDPRGEKVSGEEVVEFTHWDTACNFWTMFTSSKEFDGVRQCIDDMASTTEDNKTIPAPLLWRMAAMINAWQSYLTSGNPEGGPDYDDVLPVFAKNPDGEQVLPSSNNPCLGGIDIGEPSPEESTKAGKGAEADNPAEIAQRQAAVDAGNLAKMQGVPNATTTEGTGPLDKVAAAAAAASAARSSRGVPNNRVGDQAPTPVTVLPPDSEDAEPEMGNEPVADDPDIGEPVEMPVPQA